jgi:predicted secreted Zn-dependent protease
MMKGERAARAGAIALALLLACATARAQIHVCKDASGHPVFSDIACGADAKVIQVNPASGRRDAAPDERVRVEYYDVRGTTWNALREQIESKGPEGWWGVTQSGTSYHMDMRMTAEGCVGESVRVTSDARVRLPNWADRYEGPRRLQAYWDGVIRTLDLHERGHVQINLDGSREVERALKSIPPMSSCDALRDEARRRFQEIRASIARRQAAYDEETNHGRRQWTPYRDDGR